MEQLKGFLVQLMQAKSQTDMLKQYPAVLEEALTDQHILSAYQSLLDSQNNMLMHITERMAIADIMNRHITMSNATAGKDYSFTFDFEQQGLQKMGAYEIVIPEATGLQYDPATRTISGKPLQPGEYRLHLRFKIGDNTEERPFNDKEILLIINADPKSLWKNEKSDDTDPYWKADDEMASALFASHRLIIGSKRGRSHAHEGKFRDDAFAFLFMEASQWGVIAVADGAGSAKYSRRGSQIACETIKHYFAEHLTGEQLVAFESAISETVNGDSFAEAQRRLSGLLVDLLGKAAFLAQTKIKEEADAKGAVLKDYATTLIFTLVKTFPFGTAIASFWVGDGGVGIYNKPTNDLTVLGEPDSGEFAGQTRFLTMHEIFKDGAYATRIRFKLVKEFTALILMTDGITDPKFQTDANLSRIEKWHALWEDLNGNNADQVKLNFSDAPEMTAAALLQWMDFWSPGNHDDRTIAILY
jgi:serine/threonine protein phosphatase PrpC